MNAWKTLKTHAKSGTSLVEMVAALLIFSILMTMIVAVIHPASKIFVQMQRLQYAQVILDNTMQELRGTALEASGNGYVKIYGACSPDTDLTREEGAETGAALEFVNSEGYAVLLSADGCPETDIFLGSAAVGTASKDQIPAGRLLARYYVRNAGGTYGYQDKDGKKTARAVHAVFTDGYYMGAYLELEFSYPGTPDSTRTEADGSITEFYRCLYADLRLYSDPERTRLEARESAVLDFRVPIKRQDGFTAQETGI